MGNLVALPLVWIITSNWLSNFAYRISLDPTVFIITLGSTLFIGVLTVSIQSVRAAYTSPTDSLKEE